MSDTGVHFVTVQHPGKRPSCGSGRLRFDPQDGFFSGAGKARSASDPPHERAAQRLRMGVLNGYFILKMKPFFIKEE